MLGSCRWCCLAAAMHWVIHLPNWSFGVAQFRKPRTLQPARLHHSRKVAAVWRGMPWLRQQKRWWGGGSSFISLIPSWQNLKLLKFQQFSPVSVAAMFFCSFWRMLSTKTHIWAKNWRHWTGTETWAIYQNWGYKDHGFGEFVYSNHLCENFKSFDKSCPTSSPCHQNFFERGWLKWIFFFTVNPYFWSD